MFRSIDIPEDKALKAATALGQRDQDVASLKPDMSGMKLMMGFVLAFQVAIFAKLFSRASCKTPPRGRTNI